MGSASVDGTRDLPWCGKARTNTMLVGPYSTCFVVSPYSTRIDDSMQSRFLFASEHLSMSLPIGKAAVHGSQAT